jgi:uncharacterized protein
VDDRAIVERQLGREPRAFLRAVVRCPFGAPAVTLQAPYDSAGDPFPTTFYLTCRYLVAAVARIEAVGGIDRWSDLASTDERLARSLDEATAEQRVIRRELAGGRVGREHGASLDLGIGGTANPQRLKCLHAHVAFALARPGYELGERITAEIVPAWPEECCTLDGAG